MRLYHYSNKNFNGYIKPSFFGLNSYSNNSERVSGVKRSYFYLKPGSKEYYFNGARFLYIAELKETRLYNLNKDILNIVKNLKNSQDIHTEVKKRGYRGLIGSNGYKCGVLFYPIKIKDRKDLARGF